MKADEHRAPAPQPEPELHVAGVLVHARPHALAGLERTVRSIEGAEVYQASPEGRVVVILEGPDTRTLLDTMDHLRALPGVINVSLAYQHAEPLAAMQEEIRP